MKKLCILSLCFAVFFCFTPTAGAAADNYPEKEIRILVSLGAGGGIDRMARSMQRELSKELGATVIIENQPGAEGRFAYNNFLKAPKDGYTILVASHLNIIMARARDEQRYKLEDLAFINANWIDPVLLVAHKNLGWKNLDDMITAARKNPGKYSFGLPGPSTIGSLAPKKLFELLKLDIKLVPYDSGGSARPAILGGHLDMTGGGADGMNPVRDVTTGIGIFWDTPVKLFAEAAPVNEQLKKYNVQVPSGAAIRLFAVHSEFKRNYPERYAKLLAAFKKVITTNKDFMDFCDKANIGREWYGPEKTTQMVEADDKDWLAIIRQMPAK